MKTLVRLMVALLSDEELEEFSRFLLNEVQSYDSVVMDTFDGQGSWHQS
jgi:hypothetical protein